MVNIEGICPIIATPFTPAGEVDFDSLRSLLRTLIQGGCHALTLFGIAGEYYKLSETEKLAMVKLVVEECRRAGVPSIISVTQHASELAVKEALLWQELGADCLMLLPPFFLKPSGGDIAAHIRAVGKAVSIPVMVQYAPEQTGIGIEAGVFQRLSQDVETLCYYKIECKPPGPYIARLLELTHNKVKICAGNAGFQMIENYDRGATGTMPGCSMFDQYLDIHNLYFQGQRSQAMQMHNALLPMLNHIRQNVEQIIYYEKKILQRRGIIAYDTCRTPTFTTDRIFDSLFEEYYQQLSPLFTWRKG